MAAAPPPQPQPEQPPIPPEVVRFEEKVKFWLAVLVILAFVGIVGLWTFHPPHMPGSTDGMIIGGFLTTLGLIGGYYWQVSKKQ